MVFARQSSRHVQKRSAAASALQVLGPDPVQPTVQLGRGRRTAVRILALLGLLTFSFMLVFVVNDAAGRVGVEHVLEEPGSPEARYGADHPGEALHLAGALAAIAIGGVGLIGLIVQPERTGSAYHTGATAIAMLVTAAVVGDPDNYGGQGLLVDPVFVVMALPPLAAAVVARPWRTAAKGLKRPRYLALAAAALPALWYGVGQGLLQRNTWPPMADPHHQAHWYAMALLAAMVVFVSATAALSGRGWRLAALTTGLAAISVAVVSWLAPDAGSALAPAWAAAALLWGLAVLAGAGRALRRGTDSSRGRGTPRRPLSERRSAVTDQYPRRTPREPGPGG